MVSLVTLKYFFFFNDTATTEIYTLSLHDALPISKPNTSGTIKVPASLRSERCSPSARNAVRVPVGISVRLRRNPHNKDRSQGLGSEDTKVNATRIIILCQGSENPQETISTIGWLSSS